MSNSDANNLHVVLLPWSAFGHLIPFYHLATSLATNGVRVSYISTPKNIVRLPKIPPNLIPLMQYVSLPMPEVTNLPKGAEATIDVNDNDNNQYLKIAYDLLRDPFEQYVSSASPDWIISDLIAHWVPEKAQNCNAKLIFFSIFGATLQSFMGAPQHLVGEGQKIFMGTPECLMTPPPWAVDVFSPTVAFQDYEAATVHDGFYGCNASGVTDTERLASVLVGSHAVAIRSCNEFEGEFIELYQKLLNKPVLPLGMLSTNHVPDDPEPNFPKIVQEAFKWLDQQTPNSVVYVGFGSEYKLKKQEVHEVAYGLELAQLPFVWALRKPFWAVDDDEALPPGFLSRTSGKGVVCLGWVPQSKILSHPSVGGCLVHGGWGSIVETLQYGHNLVVLPFVIDQGLNARMLEAKGFCTEVQRENGEFTGKHVADALKRGIIGDEATNMKIRAKEAAKSFFSREEHYIREFVHYLRSTT